MMIDLHSHLIPGVDDGAEDLEKSLELARLAVSEGVEHMVLTPHHRNGRYLNRKADVLAAVQQLREDYKTAGIPMKVYASQEIRINEQFFDDLYNDDLLPLDESGRYYLIEFPTASIPDYAWSLINEMINQGITPVIAHPERNHVFAKDMNLLQKYIEAGCVSQITSSSYVGLYGSKLQDICNKMIGLNLIHILASDVHHMKHRPINLEKAFDILRQEHGQETVDYFQENARSIFNGDPVKARKPQKKRKKFLGLF
ncbi:hypothetical protein GIY11_02230 [Aerococcaceae bacterium DSM 109653]|uniref:Tyrosine-protein phosphatase n=1 Tax=Fundicoccus ignavus TaxID=2664442 RepID=A0A844BWJ2_9LACT|nr:CpsB/CapC family capsule biosynthesis tyrosine phosphatase [Fundicoccus ignavus]MRI80846.1 hypothetical protein [Fundicoccus ignavus]